ncbi:uncharacterized protein LOC110939156 isoform X2 [Helianthus annuus]|uniref:uncharacterized protein LOC110939156 isoform X2 n=1 Tax=Helianthus annuus TaxID=4232 RepID=UPI000B90043E|nr:uncharacterized protein LOC110939156 isoform X2 [Helianthus annuus]
MSKKKNFELLGLLRTHNKTYTKLLEQVCNGQDWTMGTAKRDLFWSNFVSRLCQKTGLENKKDMDVACQHYCDDLKLTYKYMRKTSNPYPIECVSVETWGQMTRIFGGCTPSTSTGRSSQSRGSTSSRRSGVYKQVKKDVI